jgi:hypothetical protein
LAVCSVDSNGEVDAGCYTPQSGAEVEVQNWALTIVTGERRAPAQPLSAEDYAIINGGFYQRTDGTLVRFRMPILPAAIPGEGVDSPHTREEH